VAIGGRVVSLVLWEDRMPWQWLRGAAEEDLAALRLVTVAVEPSASQMRLLERLAAAHPHVALDLSGKAPLAKLLERFEPRCLLLDSETSAQGVAELLPKETALEVLWLSAERLDSLEFLGSLPKLRRLLLSDWKKEDPLPDQCQQLRSVAFLDCSLKSLAPLRHLGQLDEVCAWECRSLADITPLEGLRGLRMLHLGDCGQIKDLSVLSSLPQLAWFRVPPQTSQEAFAKLVAEHPGLDILEMSGCTLIKDLSPLRSLRRLRGLALLSTHAPLDPVQELKSLRLLIVPGDFLGSNAARVAALSRALPECFIIEGSACLGSGWVLLLVPAAAGAWLVAARRRRRLRLSASHG
jgi:hypothetical protein